MDDQRPRAEMDERELMQRVRRAWTEPRQEAPPEDALARYSIRKRIGQGGMGVVYEAEQRSPRRMVALKVIRPGLTSERALKRLEFEAEILGRLDHQGIARVFEAGSYTTDEGPQPFFAMEFVRGEPLEEFVDRTSPSARERIELCVQICRAIQHAHERGVIHCDLKPANILVDGEGRTRVLDFGVAHATDIGPQGTTAETHAHFAGTLPYMSPEQLHGRADRLDPRSDVYALGVLVFELLCGERPIDLTGLSLPEAILKIQNTPPEKLGSVNPRLRGDLETIVAKALEKDRTRRYASAADLAGDLVHYVRNEPISARPPSAVYQLEKFTRRHRALVLGVLGVFLALTLGMTGTTIQAARARAAERDADARRDEAVTSEQKARAVQDLLLDVLAAANPSAQARRPDYTVREALDEAAAQLDDGWDGQPGVEATLRTTLGNAYHGLGLYEHALRHLSRALELRRMLVSRSATGNAATDAAAVWDALGSLHHSRGQHVEAERCHRAGLELLRGAPDEVDELRDSLGINLGSALLDQGKYEEAEAPLVDSARRMEARLGGHPDVASALMHVARLRHAQGETSLAYDLCARAQEIYRQQLGEAHPYTIANALVLAERLVQTGAADEAEELLMRTLEIARTQLGEQHPTVAGAHYQLAFQRESSGRLAEAQQSALQSLELRRNVLVDHPDIATSLVQVAILLQKRGDFASAEEPLREALAIRRRFLGDRHPEVATILYSLVGIVDADGRAEEAEFLAREALAILEEKVADNHPRTAIARRVLADVLRRRGHNDEAAQLYERALIDLETAYGERSSILLPGVVALGDLYAKAGRLDLAERHYRRMHEIHTVTFEHADPKQDKRLIKLARVLESAGKAREALELYADLLEQRPSPLVDAEARWVVNLEEAVRLADRHGDPGESVPWYRELISTLVRMDAPQHQLDGRRIRLARALRRSGQAELVEAELNSILADADWSQTPASPNAVRARAEWALTQAELGDVGAAENGLALALDAATGQTHRLVRPARWSLELAERLLQLDERERAGYWLGRASELGGDEATYRETQRLLADLRDRRNLATQ